MRQSSSQSSLSFAKVCGGIGLVLISVGKSAKSLISCGRVAHTVSYADDLVRVSRFSDDLLIYSDDAFKHSVEITSHSLDAVDLYEFFQEGRDSDMYLDSIYRLAR